MLVGFRAESTTSAARWNGETDVVINTVRVTECGGAARLWHSQDLLRALLKAASDRLHPPRDLSRERLAIFDGMLIYTSLLPST